MVLAYPVAGEASLRRLFVEEQALSRNVLRENERLKHELSALAIFSQFLGLQTFEFLWYPRTNPKKIELLSAYYYGRISC